MNTCRLCGKTEFEGRGHLFKYGVRHYAHAGCGLKKWGVGFFDKLPVHVLRQFPALVASSFGLLPALEDAVRERREK